MALLLSLCFTALSKDRLISKLLSDAGSGCHAPTTNAEEEQLSAITSSSENLKFSYRESITSMAGAHACMNSGISSSDISLSRSFFNKKAISGSALGWMNFSKGKSSPLLYCIASVSLPHIMSCTPICSILANEVNPSLSPANCSPRVYRSSSDSLCISYASSSVKFLVLLICAVALAVAAALSSVFAISFKFIDANVRCEMQI
jgi:hypothetical protein